MRDFINDEGAVLCPSVCVREIGIVCVLCVGLCLCHGGIVLCVCVCWMVVCLCVLFCVCDHVPQSACLWALGLIVPLLSDMLIATHVCVCGLCALLRASLIVVCVVPVFGVCGVLLRCVCHLSVSATAQRVCAWLCVG